MLLNSRIDKLLTYNKNLNITWAEGIIIPALQRESQSQNATVLKKWDTPSAWTFPNSMPVLYILMFHGVGLLFCMVGSTKALVFALGLRLLF